MPKQVITYETFDGRSFADIEEARAHEDQEFAKAAEGGAMVYVSELLQQCRAEPQIWGVVPERSVVEGVVRRLFMAGGLK